MDEVEQLMSNMPPSVLRCKGFIPLTDGRILIVQKVGRRLHSKALQHQNPFIAANIVAIGLAENFSPAELDRLVYETIGEHTHS
jgi:G3E family GTPase